MIDTIIFDFGDVFINLDKQGTINSLKELGLSEWNEDLNQLNLSFEKGQISEENFLLGTKTTAKCFIRRNCKCLECRFT